MKKSTLLSSIANLKAQVEGEELKEETKLRLLDLLLDYVNDKDIRDAIEEVPM